jgi:hypothetical protein
VKSIPTIRLEDSRPACARASVTYIKGRWQNNIRKCMFWITRWIMTHIITKGKSLSAGPQGTKKYSNKRWVLLLWMHDTERSHRTSMGKLYVHSAFLFDSKNIHNNKKFRICISSWGIMTLANPWTFMTIKDSPFWTDKQSNIIMPKKYECPWFTIILKQVRFQWV